ncbi:membrane-associated tyrosine- and threonine-specific cdc2-inhibitory kinase wee-1.3-like [Diabrotica undecimpunctata]|uniref:membrane-associated tyrosine- and threonine-specific cdc2-inhibitory kinase wee-1.3-like n=1 Tax=Diabrotica undecimpunctata TaxID=50387 RepID=UPI003B63F351
MTIPYRKITVIQCYAPTNTSPPEDKEVFYEQLEQTTQQVNQGDILIVMGDMNAKVGEDNINLDIRRKAQPSYWTQPVDLDPHYDSSLDESYMNQIFTSIRNIGEGGFGYVFKATHKHNKRKYALKKSKNNQILDWTKYNEIIHYELVGHHPHILRYFMAWEENFYTYLMLELSQMSFHDYVMLTKDVPEAVYFDCIHDICLALDYLSTTRGLIHYDVKDRNILIHGKSFKLADFGAVVLVPEPFRHTRSSGVRKLVNSQDIFSFGHSLATSIEQLAESCGTKNCVPLLQLVKRMRTRNPVKRPTAQEILGLKVMRDAVRRYKDGERPIYTTVNLEDIAVEDYSVGPRDIEAKENIPPENSPPVEGSK